MEGEESSTMHTKSGIPCNSPSISRALSGPCRRSPLTLYVPQVRSTALPTICVHAPRLQGPTERHATGCTRRSLFDELLLRWCIGEPRGPPRSSGCLSLKPCYILISMANHHFTVSSDVHVIDGDMPWGQNRRPVRDVAK
jgi:hypothetical protein